MNLKNNTIQVLAEAWAHTEIWKVDSKFGQFQNVMRMSCFTPFRMHTTLQVHVIFKYIWKDRVKTNKIVQVSTKLIEMRKYQESYEILKFC